MNTTTTILDDAQEAQPLHIQIARLCKKHGLDFTVVGCENEDHSLWTISANGWGTICKELWRKEAYWFLKGFLLANPEVYVSQQTLHRLQNADVIEILTDNDWYREITIDEAIQEIKRGCEIRQREDFLWDTLSECWTPTGGYRIELK